MQDIDFPLNVIVNSTPIKAENPKSSLPFFKVKTNFPSHSPKTAKIRILFLKPETQKLLYYFSLKNKTNHHQWSFTVVITNIGNPISSNVNNDQKSILITVQNQRLECLERTLYGLTYGTVVHECSSCSILRSLQQNYSVPVSLHIKFKITKRQKHLINHSNLTIKNERKTLQEPSGLKNR